jgi:hypothetical protein
MGFCTLEPQLAIRQRRDAATYIVTFNHDQKQIMVLWSLWFYVLCTVDLFGGGVHESLEDDYNAYA